MLPLKILILGKTKEDTFAGLQNPRSAFKFDLYMRHIFLFVKESFLKHTFGYIFIFLGICTERTIQDHFF